jgi:hypothetical protein
MIYIDRLQPLCSMPLGPAAAGGASAGTPSHTGPATVGTFIASLGQTLLRKDVWPLAARAQQPS